LSRWNVKKNKNCRFGTLCQVLHSAKDPVVECHGHSTRQSWKNGRSENRFFSLGKYLKKKSNFAECQTEGTRQRIFFKKKFKLCRVPARGHSAKNFFLKKIQTLPSAGQRALGKEFFFKKIQTLLSAS